MASLQNTITQKNIKKRNGTSEEYDPIKLTKYLEQYSYKLDEKSINLNQIIETITSSLPDEITTQELEKLTEETIFSASSTHPDLLILLLRISLKNLYDSTPPKFSEAIQLLRDNIELKTKNLAPMIGKKPYKFIMENKDMLDEYIEQGRDYKYGYTGFKTMYNQSYLLKACKKVVERPQYKDMRISCGLHCGDLPKIFETYDLLSKHYYTHGSPFIFNSCTPHPQLSSCFLLCISDSIKSIYGKLKMIALLSKNSGGIGFDATGIRARGSYIKGTDGYSNGIVPMLKVFNDTARYVDQGGGKRKGSFAVYLQPWHADIEEFLLQKKNSGADELRSRDLFYGLWVPDLFMKRVEENGDWTLMCPNECPGLVETWGKEFEELYTKYENSGMGRKTIKARDLMHQITVSAKETGTPYILFKDTCNEILSNQQNLGTIRCSNLCAEIVEYVSEDEIAVCNLASLSLPMFVSTLPKSAHKDSTLRKVHKKIQR